MGHDLFRARGFETRSGTVLKPFRNRSETAQDRFWNSLTSQNRFVTVPKRFLNLRKRKRSGPTLTVFYDLSLLSIHKYEREGTDPPERDFGPLSAQPPKPLSSLVTWVGNGLPECGFQNPPPRIY